MKRMALLVVVCLAVTAMAASWQHGQTYKAIHEIDTLSDSTKVTDTVNVHVIQEYYRGVTGYVIIDGSPTPSLQGVGLDDSGSISVRTVNGLVSNEVASADCANLPCTCLVSSANTGDTLFKNDWEVVYSIIDTASDSSFNVTWPVKIQLNWK